MLIVLSIIAAVALQTVVAGSVSNPPAFRWPFVALAVLIGAVLWSEIIRAAPPAAQRTRRHLGVALLILAVLVLETEAGFFAALAAGNSFDLASAANHASVRWLALGGAALMVCAIWLGAVSLRRDQRLSLADAAIGIYLLAGLLISLVVYARTGDVAAAALPFGDYFAAALIYLPVRMFVRTPRQARLSAAALVALAVFLATAASPSLVAAARLRRVTSASPTAPPRWMPAGWTLQDDAMAVRRAAGGRTRYTTRVTAGAGDADFRMAIPDWFVVPGQPIAATAFLRNETAGHLDLQLFQRDRSAYSSRHRVKGEWETLVAEMVADLAPAPVGLDVNLARQGAAEIESIIVSSPRGRLRVLGANRMIWEPPGWNLLQADAGAERIADGYGERLRLTARTAAADFRYAIAPRLSRSGQKISVTAQVYATRPIARLQLIVRDTVVDTAKHQGSGWETLVVTGTPRAGQVAVDIDLEPGEAQVQSVALDARGSVSMLLGQVGDLAALSLSAPIEPRPSAGARRARSYAARLADAPAGAASAVLVMLAVLTCAALVEILRRARYARAPLDKGLAAAIMLIALGGFAALILMPSLLHPGFSLIGFAAVAAAHALGEGASAR